MNNKNGKSALIVEGGGMRSIFAAGVLHSFGKYGFDPFDLYFGVSAGACHLASHLAGQNDRNFDITLQYSIKSDFINLWRFLRGGHLVDLDWMWDQTIRNYGLDLIYLFNKLHSQMKEYIVVATSMETGQPFYLQPDENTLEDDLKVSSSMPVFYRNILKIGNESATDGGIADSIPVREACNRGATDITVIRSRSAGYVKKRSILAEMIFSLYFRKYPNLVKTFRERAANYMESIAFMHNPPEGVRITQIIPPDNITLGRTTKRETPLRSAYETGIDYGSKFIKSFQFK